MRWFLSTLLAGLFATGAGYLVFLGVRKYFASQRNAKLASDWIVIGAVLTLAIAVTLIYS